MPPPACLVVDTSVTTGWFHPAQSDAYSQAVFALLERLDVWVPVLWRLETVNTFCQLARRGRLAEEQRDAILESAFALPLLDAPPASWQDVARLSVRHGLTAYDAEYLACARELGARLATRDVALVAAARAEGLWYELSVQES